MYVEPNTTIHLLERVPLNKSYEHTVHYPNKTEQFNAFMRYKVYTLNNYSYQRAGIGRPWHSAAGFSHHRHGAKPWTPGGRGRGVKNAPPHQKERGQLQFFARAGNIHRLPTAMYVNDYNDVTDDITSGGAP